MVMINIMINICFLESIDSPKPQCFYGIYDTKKWKVQESNLRPFARQASALPAELTFHALIVSINIVSVNPFFYFSCVGA